jgi:oxalate decarboxylase/phosphoglucose isomerase-like protein (cupin superfamily)
VKFFLKQFRVHLCADGGVLYEIYKKEGWGQLAIRTVLPGVTVGGHKHPSTNEIWLVFKGAAAIFLEYPDKTRWIKRVSEETWEPIGLPAGTGHDIKNVGDDEMAFFFFADKLYDSKNPDKEDWEW